MKRSIELVRTPLDEAALLAARAPSTTSGAVLTFLGVVRGQESGAPIEALDYEAFDAMARHQFGLVLDELERRWPVVESFRVVHRLGVVPVGEPSLWVEISTPHRAESFAAAAWFIDEMKRVVPIWKRTVPVRSPA